MLGLIVNFATIAIGGLIGLVIKSGLPEKVSDLLMKGMGLCVCYIGVCGMMDGESTLVTVLSVAIGAILGAFIDIDDKFTRLSKKIESKLKKDGKGGNFTEGFTTATFVFMVGAMAIVGGLKAGLGDNSTLLTKAIIDGVCAIVFASTLGYGVIFSSVPVTLYQGIFVAMSSVASSYLTDYMINEMSCVGGILIFGIGLNLLQITNIKVMNMILSLFIPIILCLFM